MTADSDYLAALEAWKAERLAKLKAPDGWLNIIGRFPLQQGTVSVGSAADNDIVLAVGPAYVGSLTEDAGGRVTFTPADGGPPLQLELNRKKPPQFTVDRLLLEVTTINETHALRVRDTQSTAPDHLPPLRYFDPDPGWRIVADWVPYETPMGLTVDTTGSIATEVAVTHKAVFTHAGTRLELLATHGTPAAPQFVIRDLTARDSTYPASRFVYGEEMTDSTVVLDFNKAINPPCAFTDFAVCPLPPPQNVLPFRIEAGEKRLT